MKMNLNLFQIGSAIFFGLLAFIINGLTDLKFWPLCFGSLAIASLIGTNKVGLGVFALAGVFFVIALFAETEWLLKIISQLQ